MITALSKKNKKLSQRASQASAERLYPPEGSSFIKITYLRWQFFTGKGESEWDSLFLTEDDATRLFKQLADRLGLIA